MQRRSVSVGCSKVWQTAKVLQAGHLAGCSLCCHLDLHLPPVLVKLLLQLGGLTVVALQLAAGNNQPEGNEDNDAAQHDWVDQPCQHCVHKPAA